jgi:hypothetical protein
MTTPITAYSDTDRVRAALGVDSVDVSDDVLVDMMLEQELMLDLGDWLPLHGTLLGNSLSALELYAAAFCALSALDGRELLYPFMFKDGKAETRRFQLDLQKLKEDLAARVAKWKAKIIDLEDMEVATVKTASYIMGAAVPDTDPVTGA